MKCYNVPTVVLSHGELKKEQGQIYHINRNRFLKWFELLMIFKLLSCAFTFSNSRILIEYDMFVLGRFIIFLLSTYLLLFQCTSSYSSSIFNGLLECEVHYINPDTVPRETTARVNFHHLTKLMATTENYISREHL